VDTSFKKNGLSSSQQGRPASGHGSSISLEIQEKIRLYRKNYNGWGAKTILTELQVKDGYPESDLPSLSTLNRFLKSEGLLKKYAKNIPLPNPKRTAVSQAHECWQMDDKGPEHYEGVGHIGMINIKVVHSSTYINSVAISLPHTRSHPKIADYQYVLRLSFQEFGLPLSIQADHGSNRAANRFYENRSKSPFPTDLHLWLLGLGVNLVWANAYRPTEQGTVERSHQTTHMQNKRTKPFKNLTDFQNHVNQRRKQLNEYIPCDTFGKPPLVGFPESVHSKRFYNPLMEEIGFDINRIDAYLKDKKWFRKVSSNKTISLGGHVYYLPKCKINLELSIQFDPNSRCLIFHNDKELVATLPIKGCDFEHLAGENFTKCLKNRQLEIPFDWNIHKIVTTF
jgi:hypothetical protein